MRKKLGILAVMCCIALLMTGCGSNQTAKEKEAAQPAAIALLAATNPPENSSSASYPGDNGTVTSETTAPESAEPDNHMSEAGLNGQAEPDADAKAAFKRSHVPTGQLTEDGENLFFTNEAGLIGIMDFRGNILAEARWSEISGRASNGASIARTGDGEYELIDSRGSILCSFAGVFDETRLGMPMDPRSNSQVYASMDNGSNKTPDSLNVPLTFDLDYGTASYNYWLNKQYMMVWRNGKTGILDMNGRTVIQPEWDGVRLLENHYWRVMRGDLYGLADEEGNLVEEPVWESLYDQDPANEGGGNKFPSFSSRGEWIFTGIKANEFGTKCISFFQIGGEIHEMPLNVNSLSSFAYGCAVFTTSDGKMGLVDENGTIFFEGDYHSIECYFTAGGGVAIVDNLKLVNRKGDIVFDGRDDFGIYSSGMKIDCVSRFSNGYTAWGYNHIKILIDPQGNRVGSSLWYRISWDEDAELFSAVMENEKSEAWYDTDMNPVEYQKPEVITAIDKEYPDGLSRFLRDDLYGFVNEQGEIVIQPTWQQAEPFSEGLAVVGSSKEEIGQAVFGYIDTTGGYISGLQWNSAASFRDGMGIVTKGDRYGILRPDGSVMMEPQMDKVYTPSEGIRRFELDHQYGYIRNDGTVLSKLSWTYATDFQNGYAEVSDTPLPDPNSSATPNARFTVLDYEGRTLFDPVDVYPEKYSIAVYPENQMAAVLRYKSRYDERPTYYMISLLTGQSFDRIEGYTMLSIDPAVDGNGGNDIVCVGYYPGSYVQIYNRNAELVQKYEYAFVYFRLDNRCFLVKTHDDWYLYDCHGLVF